MGLSFRRYSFVKRRRYWPIFVTTVALPIWAAVKGITKLISATLLAHRYDRGWTQDTNCSTWDEENLYIERLTLAAVLIGQIWKQQQLKEGQALTKIAAVLRIPKHHMYFMHGSIYSSWPYCWLIGLPIFYGRLSRLRFNCSYLHMQTIASSCTRSVSIHISNWRQYNYTRIPLTAVALETLSFLGAFHCVVYLQAQAVTIWNVSCRQRWHFT